MRCDGNPFASWRLQDRVLIAVSALGACTLIPVNTWDSTKSRIEADLEAGDLAKARMDYDSAPVSTTNDRINKEGAFPSFNAIYFYLKTSHRFQAAARTAALKTECGNDYHVVRVGMTVERDSHCYGRFTLIGQINRKDGVLISTYQSCSNGCVSLAVIDGEIAAWNRF